MHPLHKNAQEFQTSNIMHDVGPVFHVRHQKITPLGPYLMLDLTCISCGELIGGT